MLSNYQIIKKPKSVYKDANLKDYKSVYKTFSFAKIEKEIIKNSNLNAAYIAIDQHTKTFRKNKVALYYESEAGNVDSYTFLDLSVRSNQFAYVLTKHGVRRKDRVFIFLPRIPELYISFLGILKTGAISGTLFSAFQEQALFDRLSNSNAKIVITNADLYPRIYTIWKRLPHLKKIIVVERDAKKLPKGLNILYWKKETDKEKTDFRIRKMKKDDLAFMLYTSGTTGKPKGVVHKHLAIIQQYLTAKYSLDLKEEDIYWCTADPGWVTGIAYGILGSWANGVSSLVFDGRFDANRWYKLIQDYKVTVWYTAPTAVRMLMAASNAAKINSYNFSSLRYLASVGEPLNPEAVVWGEKAFGHAFHDTWWQTELGAICISNYLCMDIKPGSMGKPFPGVTAAIVDDNGVELSDNKEGNLALRPNFPSLMKTIWKRPSKYKSYFKHGWYISGDRALRDSDGYYWFIGRADDVIKTAGERVGPFEVESALVSHPAVVEAGVIGKPDALRGEIIKAFVVLKLNIKPSDHLKEELSLYVKKNLAGHAYPREVEFIDKLPKTRSGKIMRRILKAKELGQPIGDTSTLEDY